MPSCKFFAALGRECAPGIPRHERKEEREMTGKDAEIEQLKVHTVVVGSGAAGFNAAHRLRLYGIEDVLLVTEQKNAGTSRNTGSDKQTYYKLSLSGGQPDSVRRLAQVLYDGGCVDGDHALCEAALSAQSFYKLVELGVPFPHDTYGEFVGYKTDHDPNDRGTSAGPYTSRYMTEALEKAVRQENIEILDHCQVIQILCARKCLYGVLCIDTENGSYVLIQCRNLVYATGGPAGMYGDSVYPVSQFGSNGLALEAGVLGKNLTEWQYGLASVTPRWNVSGSYMQALPRFVSTDQDGENQREFLMDVLTRPEEMMDLIFLKGYQWPFDARKAAGGSSMIDLLVYRETCVKKRRVWLDYRENPGKRPVDFAALSQETREYLVQAGAWGQTPYERLCRLNQPAVAFYDEHGVDLKSQMLEIAVCAQHNNGGLSVDAWWQTNIKGFFAVGEAAGTHGIYRPGGSALNAGQAGSTRAAQYIGTHSSEKRTWSREEEEDFLKQARMRIAVGERILEILKNKENETLSKRFQDAARQMSRYGAMLRDRKGIEQMLLEIDRELKEIEAISQSEAAGDQAEAGELKATNDQAETKKQVETKKQAETGSPAETDEKDRQRKEERRKARQIGFFYRYYDMRLCQKVYLEAMMEYIEHGGKSRGSAIYLEEACTGWPPYLPAFSLDGPDGRAHQHEVQEIGYDKNTKTCKAFWRPVRKLEEIPSPQAFEVVWKAYREKNPTMA